MAGTTAAWSCDKRFPQWQRRPCLCLCLVAVALPAMTVASGSGGGGSGQGTRARQQVPSPWGEKQFKLAFGGKGAKLGFVQWWAHVPSRAVATMYVAACLLCG